MEPSQRVSLKGLNRTKDTRVYTGSAPCGEGKSLRPVVMVLLWSQGSGSGIALPRSRAVVSCP